MREPSIPNIPAIPPMPLLAEIRHCSSLAGFGRVIDRQAVRAIILKDNQLLMLHSAVNGDYFLGGGGVEPGESHADALRREVREELGAELTEIGSAFGRVVEWQVALEPGYEFMRYTSYHYFCRVIEGVYPQQLENYEHRLQMAPVWADVDHAIAVNAAICARGSVDHMKWIRRELLVLEKLRETPGIFS
ncbi:MAG: NUDIX domain-containing protein [Anaerolineae bacterium]|nr:NUDIX domain-containing protein [Anaerolineae bacterium]